MRFSGRAAVGWISLLALAAVSARAQVDFPFRDPQLPDDERIADLLRRLTLDAMTQCGPVCAFLATDGRLASRPRVHCLVLLRRMMHLRRRARRGGLRLLRCPRGTGRRRSCSAWRRGLR